VAPLFPATTLTGGQLITNAQLLFPISLTVQGGTHTFNSQVDVSGPFSMSGGTIMVNYKLLLPAAGQCTITAGVIDGPGVTEIRGILYWSGGSFGNTASGTLLVSNILNISSSVNVLNYLILNNGLIALYGTLNGFNAAVVRNTASGSITLNTNGNFVQKSGAVSQLQNSGSILKGQGTGNSSLGFYLSHDSGTVNCTVGALQFTSGCSLVASVNAFSTIEFAGGACILQQGFFFFYI
jgi:hypothetical protein